MTRYRRLPGARRGFINSSTVWLGDDHLLLVKSSRFREEYKRFHLRDIQSIAVAQAPRFHLSTRAAAIATLWVVAMWLASFAPFFRALSLQPYLWGVACLLAFAWLYVSAAASCRCRVYTAVSADDLPSVYRTWTARKFLAAVEPKIAEVQGVIEGDWAEAAESRDIGPPLHALPASPGESARNSEARTHTPASDSLIAVLFASGLLTLLMMNAAPSARRVPTILFMFLKVALALVVFVQHYRGKLQGGMQKLAIATLLVMGVMYYGEQMVAGFQLSAEAANKRAMTQVMPVLEFGNRFAMEVDGGASLVLGCAGLGIVLLSKDTAGA